MKISPSKVIQAAKTGTPLVIQTGVLSPQTEADLEEILGIYLEQMGQPDLRNHLSYCLREMTGNAKKANTKRAYFREKNLDITNPSDYARGMAGFKKDTLEDLDRYWALQEKMGLHIRVTFLVRDRVFHLRVANNAPLQPSESRRVQERLARARDMLVMEEAFEEVLDDSEGAGLGLTILVLVLRKMGLTERAFTLETTGDSTVAALRIPQDEVHLDLIATLTDELVAVVDGLPPFPENLRQLMVLLDQPDVGFPDLASRLAIDPALTSDLIRYINSAGKGRKERVTNLRDAVQLVGLRGIREMILPYGTQKLLDKFLSQQRVLWTEAQRTSELAAGLARELRFDRQDADLAQIGGLLSSLGKIVVSYLHPEWTGKIQEFCRQKNLSLDRFNDLSQILSPAELGARVAEKWKFPSNLVEVLRYQRWPLQASPGLRKVACAIHLAGRLNGLEQGGITADQVDPAVLGALGVGGEDELLALHKKVGRD